MNTTSTERQVRRQVIQSLPGFWGYAVLSAIIFLAIQLIALIPTVLMQRVIDQLIPQRQIGQIVFTIILFCVIPLASTILSTLYRYGLAILCRKLGLKLAICGFQNLIAQPVSYFDGKNSSELAAHCRQESMQYITFWMIEVPQLFATGICGIVVFLYLLSLHWSIALTLLLYFPVAFFPSNRFATKVQELTKQIISNNAAMNQIINDTFRGIKAVKTMVLENHQIQKLKAVNEKSVAIWSRVALFDNLTGIWVNDFSSAVFRGLAFGIASFLVVLGRMTLGSIVTVINYSNRFLEIAHTFMTSNYNFKEKLGEYDQLFSILTMPTPEPSSKPFQFEKEIHFADITFAYNPERENILRSLNLSIRPHEWLGIVGASGAGKTTIFDLLLRFYEPQAGSITIDSVPLREISTVSLRSKIAKVSQDTFLFPGTIRENLLLANPNTTDEQLNAILNQVCLSKFLTQLPNGLDTNIGENGLLLSGGERQKLGLLRGCKVILLDEVTANVDRDSEEEIKNVLLQLKQEQDLTVIAISHRIDFLKDADRIVVLQNGCIQQETSYEEYRAK